MQKGVPYRATDGVNIIIVIGNPNPKVCRRRAQVDKRATWLVTHHDAKPQNISILLWAYVI